MSGLRARGDAGHWRGGHAHASNATGFISAKQQTWEHDNMLKSHYRNLANVKSTLVTKSPQKGSPTRRKTRLPPLSEPLARESARVEDSRAHRIARRQKSITYARRLREDKEAALRRQRRRDVLAQRGRDRLQARQKNQGGLVPEGKVAIAKAATRRNIQERSHQKMPPPSAGPASASSGLVSPSINATEEPSLPVLTVSSSSNSNGSSAECLGFPAVPRTRESSAASSQWGMREASSRSELHTASDSDSASRASTPCIDLSLW